MEGQFTSLLLTLLVTLAVLMVVFSTYRLKVCYVTCKNDQRERREAREEAANKRIEQFA